MSRALKLPNARCVPMLKKSVVVIATAVLALSAAACSSDKPTSAPTSTTLPGAIPDDLKQPYLRSLFVNHQSKGARFQAVYPEQAMQLEGYVDWSTGSGYAAVVIDSKASGFAAWDENTLYASDDGSQWDAVDPAVASEQSVRGVLYRLFGVVSKSAAKQPGNEALDLDTVVYAGPQDINGLTYQSFKLSAVLTLFVDESGHAARVFFSEPAIPATVTLQFVEFKDTSSEVTKFFSDHKTLQETQNDVVTALPTTTES